MRSKCIPFAIVLSLVLHQGCRAPSVQVNNLNLRIAVLDNTAPESPFTGWNTDLAPVVRAIQTENPDLLIHLGNIIQGGSSQSGVRWIDGERQFGLFRSDLSVITAFQYTVPGDTDLLDGSIMLYQVSTGRRSNYSFNLSGVHCIMLNNAGQRNNLPDRETLGFLKNDIVENRDYQSVLVFMHRPPLDRKGDSTDPRALDDFFNVLAGAPLLAVVSSGQTGYYEIHRQGVRFISLSCEAYNPYSVNNYQYYILRLRDGALSVEGRRVEKKPLR